MPDGPLHPIYPTWRLPLSFSTRLIDPFSGGSAIRVMAESRPLTVYPHCPSLDGQHAAPFVTPLWVAMTLSMMTGRNDVDGRLRLTGTTRKICPIVGDISYTQHRNRHTSYLPTRQLHRTIELRAWDLIVMPMISFASTQLTTYMTTNDNEVLLTRGFGR